MSNVPAPLTSFIGRIREIAEVKSLLKTTRLLSILGPGGCGKTRLALQVAGDVQHEFTDGVWFMDLAGLTDATFIPHTLAALLGLHETPSIPVTETLIQTLCSKTLLLIFDNCEHLVDACATFIEL